MKKETQKDQKFVWLNTDTHRKLKFSATVYGLTMTEIVQKLLDNNSENLLEKIKENII